MPRGRPIDTSWDYRILVGMRAIQLQEGAPPQINELRDWLRTTYPDTPRPPSHFKVITRLRVLVTRGYLYRHDSWGGRVYRLTPLGWRVREEEMNGVPQPD